MHKNVYVPFGTIQIAKNIMNVIRKHITDSGLQEIWSESNVFDENTAMNDMLAKSVSPQVPL